MSQGISLSKVGSAKHEWGPNIIVDKGVCSYFCQTTDKLQGVKIAELDFWPPYVQVGADLLQSWTGSIWCSFFVPSHANKHKVQNNGGKSITPILPAQASTSAAPLSKLKSEARSF